MLQDGGPQRTPIVLTRAQVRQVDKTAIEAFGMSGLVLMENAGRQVADWLQRRQLPEPYLFVCGKGNNGGDGYVAARHATLRGQRAQVAICGAAPEEIVGDAAANLAILQRCGMPIAWFGQPFDQAAFAEWLSAAGTIVDCLLGTGAQGAPRPPLDTVITMLNEHPAPKVAVDIPSGLDCDNGYTGAPTIRAAHTFTFVGLKPGLVQPGSAPFVGQVQVLDIGAPPPVVERALAES